MNNEYMRLYMAKKYKERREYAINKLGGKCVNCGCTNELEIDHIDYHNKSFNLFNSPNMAKEKFESELEKCQLLCRECHIDKSKKDIGEQFTGSNNPQSKLTEEIISYCRKVYIPRCRINGGAALARKFGVSKTTMNLAISGKFWDHVV